jgi:hypothetical protein
VDWVLILLGSSIIFIILELSKSKIADHSLRKVVLQS